MEPKVEPAGNLKGKFAGWLALVGVASRSLGVGLPLSPGSFLSLRQSASAITLPFFSVSLRLSLLSRFSLHGFPPRHALR